MSRRRVHPVTRRAVIVSGLLLQQRHCVCARAHPSRVYNQKRQIQKEVHVSDGNLYRVLLLTVPPLLLSFSLSILQLPLSSSQQTTTLRCGNANTVPVLQVNTVLLRVFCKQFRFQQFGTVFLFLSQRFGRPETHTIKIGNT